MIGRCFLINHIKLKISAWKRKHRKKYRRYFFISHMPQPTCKNTHCRRYDIQLLDGNGHCVVIGFRLLVWPRLIFRVMTHAILSRPDHQNHSVTVWFHCFRIYEVYKFMGMNLVFMFFYLSNPNMDWVFCWTCAYVWLPELVLKIESNLKSMKIYKLKTDPLSNYSSHPIKTLNFQTQPINQRNNKINKTKHFQ